MAPGQDSDPGRRASAELPLYGVERWPGQRQVEGVSGTDRGGGRGTLTSVGVGHHHGDMSITVTSHRPQENGLAALQRWVSQTAVRAAAAWRDEMPWANVTVAVDGQPTLFQCCEVPDGRWLAVGQAPGADLTLDSRHVPLAGLVLVRVTDLPLPELPSRLERPRTPARQFPADADPAGVIPDHARVELTFERSRLLSGSVGGQPVRLDLNVPGHSGAAAGTIAGIPASATWENADNYRIYPDVPADLQGSFAGQAVELHATFHLEPGYFFDHGTISGQIGADALDVTIEPAVGGLGSTRTVAADGTLGSTEFTIYAAIDGPLTAGQIRGTVAGASIRLDAARTRQPGGEQTRLSGSYQGPPALLALAVGALLYFI